MKLNKPLSLALMFSFPNTDYVYFCKEFLFCLFIIYDEDMHGLSLKLQTEC